MITGVGEGVSFKRKLPLNGAAAVIGELLTIKFPEMTHLVTRLIFAVEKK